MPLGRGLLKEVGFILTCHVSERVEALDDKDIQDTGPEEQTVLWDEPVAPYGDMMCSMMLHDGRGKENGEITSCRITCRGSKASLALLS